MTYREDMDFQAAEAALEYIAEEEPLCLNCQDQGNCPHCEELGEDGDYADYDEHLDGDDGQPTEYDEWQDLHGGDDWDHGQYDSYDGE